MAEWLRPADCEVLTIKLRGIEPGQVLITKSPQGRVVPKSRSLVTVAGIDRIRGVRMAEWLRPRNPIAENGLNIRRISVGLISCPSKSPWAGRMVLKSRPVVTMAGIDHILKAGWPSG